LWLRGRSGDVPAFTAKSYTSLIAETDIIRSIAQNRNVVKRANALPSVAGYHRVKAKDISMARIMPREFVSGARNIPAIGSG
jgi:hypothetical protein